MRMRDVNVSYSTRPAEPNTMPKRRKNVRMFMEHEYCVQWLELPCTLDLECSERPQDTRGH
jgi:hypothetical protein